MKFVTTLALITLLFSSCTKKYSCKCTTTLTEMGYYPYETVTLEQINKNTSKKKATQLCNNAGKQIQANTSEQFPDYITVGTKCELKDY